MEVRQAMQHVLRAGARATPSQCLMAQSASRWTPRCAPTALNGAMQLRSISNSPARWADKNSSRPPRPTALPFASSSTTTPTNASTPSSIPTPWSIPQTTTSSQATKPASSAPSDLFPFGDSEDPMDLAREIGRETDDWLQKHMPKRPPPPDLRLRPSTGRTIHVQGHVDVARSLQLLAMLTRRNKLPQMVSKQRFHERPGLKRKRLRRERWRARFREGFKATITRVKDLTKQGW